MLKAKCIFCCRDENITKEHALSRNLFPDGFKKRNIITVTSCRECNSSYSHDEELFRIFLVNQSTEKSQDARDVLHTKITRAMKKAPGKAFNVLKTMSPVKIRNSNGDKEEKVVFRISKRDWKGHHRVLDKYTKALFYHHVGRTIPAEFEIKHMFIQNFSLIPDEIRSTLRWNLDNKEIYGYGYAIVPETLQSVWTFVFYGHVIFQTIVARPEDLNDL